MNSFKPSKYQQDIFDWVNETQSGNLVVEALAGSGKTTTGVEVFKLLAPEIDAIFVAFNKHIATELSRRLPKTASARTYHSLGFSIVRNAFGDVQVETKKADMLLDKFLPRQYNYWKYPPIKKLAGLVKANLCGTTDAELSDLALYYGIDLNNGLDPSEIFSAVRRIVKESAEWTSIVDFDDMCWLPIHLDLPANRYDFLFVDELQDTNAVQTELVLRSVKPNGRIVAVGDRLQCLPEGTAILCSSGKMNTKPKYKRIEDLKIGEMLVGYSSGRSHFTGHTTQGRKVTSIHKEMFDGKMIKIATQNFGKVVSCTPNHKWLVKISKKYENKYILYLMQGRGGKARVGIAKAFLRPGSGLSVRSRQEESSRSWILAVFDTKQRATEAELFTQAKFGIPGLIFKNRGDNFMPQDMIDHVYRSLGNLSFRVKRCLSYYHREYEFPLWTNDGSNYHVGAKSFITEACNLIPDFMLVKTHNSKVHDSLWEDVVYINREQRTVPVYGITVEPGEDGRRLYVANGIVSHNSIYAFAGAGAEAVPNFINATNADILPLSITYRNPKTVVNLVTQTFPDIPLECPEWAIDGEILTLNEKDVLDHYANGDMALCRVNAPLVQPCFALIREGRKATIRGRDIGKNLANMVKKMKADNDIHILLTRLRDYRLREVSKLMDSDKFGQAAVLEDKIDTIVAISDGCQNVDEVQNKINTTFSDEVEGVIFSSIHKAKGLEAKNIYLLRPDLLPHPMAKQAWEAQQEKNLKYVAYTRTLEKLTIVL
ncbi:MAG: AAA family ATPase [Gammaproteobacteria bacterium]|nr:AAA family ATPase [Gammaproteobacteria bacterium]